MPATRHCVPRCERARAHACMCVCVSLLVNLYQSYFFFGTRVRLIAWTPGSRAQGGVCDWIGHHATALVVCCHVTQKLYKLFLFYMLIFFHVCDRVFIHYFSVKFVWDCLSRRDVFEGTLPSPTERPGILLVASRLAGGAARTTRGATVFWEECAPRGRSQRRVANHNQGKLGKPPQRPHAGRGTILVGFRS